MVDLKLKRILLSSFLSLWARISIVFVKKIANQYQGHKSTEKYISWLMQSESSQSTEEHATKLTKLYRQLKGSYTSTHQKQTKNAFRTKFVNRLTLLLSASALYVPSQRFICRMKCIIKCFYDSLNISEWFKLQVCKTALAGFKPTKQTLNNNVQHLFHILWHIDFILACLKSPKYCIIQKRYSKFITVKAIYI